MVSEQNFKSAETWVCMCTYGFMCVNVAYTVCGWKKTAPCSRKDHMVLKRGCTHTHHMSGWRKEQTSKHLHLASIRPACFIVTIIHNSAHPLALRHKPTTCSVTLVFHMTYRPTYGNLHFMDVEYCKAWYWKTLSALQHCLRNWSYNSYEV